MEWLGGDSVIIHGQRNIADATVSADDKNIPSVGEDKNNRNINELERVLGRGKEALWPYGI